MSERPSHIAFSYKNTPDKEIPREVEPGVVIYGTLGEVKRVTRQFKVAATVSEFKVFTKKILKRFISTSK